MPTVRAKFGLQGYLWNLGGIVTMGALIWILSRKITSASNLGVFDILIVPIILIGSYRLLADATAHIEVSVGKLLSREFGKQTVLDLSRVNSIEIGYYGFGHSAFNLHLESTIDTKRRTLSLSMRVFANRDQVAKAIVDATLSVNPNVKLSPEILERFGLPPYGIFLSKRGE